MLFMVADSLGFDEIAFSREITLITFPSTTGTALNQEDTGIRIRRSTQAEEIGELTVERVILHAHLIESYGRDGPRRVVSYPPYFAKVGS